MPTNCFTQCQLSWTLPGIVNHHLPGQPVPVPHHSFREEIFPNIQSKPLLVQPEAIMSCLKILFALWEVQPAQGGTRGGWRGVSWNKFSICKALGKFKSWFHLYAACWVLNGFVLKCCQWIFWVLQVGSTKPQGVLLSSEPQAAWDRDPWKPCL